MIRKTLKCAVLVAATLAVVVPATAMADDWSRAHQQEVAIQMARDACYTQHFNCGGVGWWNIYAHHMAGDVDTYEFYYETECGTEWYVVSVEYHWHSPFPGIEHHHHHGAEVYDDHKAGHTEPTYGCSVS
jgi:hypothetical protein